MTKVTSSKPLIYDEILLSLEFWRPRAAARLAQPKGSFTLRVYLRVV